MNKLDYKNIVFDIVRALSLGTKKITSYWVAYRYEQRGWRLGIGDIV